MPDKPQGFAAIDPAQQRAIAKQGGITAHALGRAHQWTSEEAREAGRKGGLARRDNQNRRRDALQQRARERYSRGEV